MVSLSPLMVSLSPLMVSLIPLMVSLSNHERSKGFSAVRLSEGWLPNTESLRRR